jgi:hypothetical protein
MFDPCSYTIRIRDKILEAIEQSGNHRPLQRPIIEQIYPRVRGRSLFGREIGIEARYSPISYLSRPPRGSGGDDRATAIETCRAFRSAIAQQY